MVLPIRHLTFRGTGMIGSAEDVLKLLEALPQGGNPILSMVQPQKLQPIKFLI
ncbi:hypothetical protein MHB43_17825 [Paenibacillus sp. FSL H8-0317]|uniref:hypothetical protein n=1 Tax=Paenibacillus sp. FSL H8-0317 TaxID=2921385 RepID=UPI003244A0C1